MSHISASEKPAPAATPLTAPITGYGMRRKSTIAWCSTSAPRRTFAGRSTSGSSRPPLNQLTSPPEEKARSPAPVTISARSGAWSASQPAAIVSSKIISGLIALRESGRSRVSVPISPRSRSRAFRGWAGSGSWRCSSGSSGGIGGGCEPYPLRRERQVPSIPVAEQRKRLPDQPGVYLFKDERRRGHVRRQGDLDPQAGRRPLLGQVDQRRRRDGRRIVSIDFLVTETEAEALLAEQQFIKRHRPLFNIRLRDDKSYPYIGISLDEEFPRVYFTRERHRSQRIYFGPYSSAKRVRETLDLLGRLFQYRTCDGPEPGRRSGVPVPRLLHQALRGALRRLRRPRGVPARDRRDRRLPLRPLPRRRARPGAQDGRGRGRRGVRARRRVPRPARGGALADGAAHGRRRELRLGRPGRGRGRGLRGERAGVPGPRRGARRAPRLLPRQRGGARRGRGDRGVPRPVLLGGALGAAAGRRRPGARRARRSCSPRRSRARRGGPVEVRVAERGLEAAAARARRAQRRARARPGQAPQERRRAQRVDALSSLQDALGLDEPAGADRGLRHLEHGGEHTVASMVVFQGGAPRKSRLPALPDPRRPHRGSGRLRLDGGGALPARRQLLEQSDRSPHDAERDESFAARPRPDRDRRRQGSALGRDEGRSRRWSSAGRR